MRQGDPLSCLLFLIAIEPLSKMIRTSGRLNGLKIRKNDDTLQSVLLALFADDATAFISENDKISTLFEILQTWCRASGTKFNVAKTVAIPVGSPEYRERVAKTRKLDPNEDEQINANIQILRDGEPTRILGAYLGNRVSNMHQWPEILEKIESRLQNWDRFHPTLEGR